MMRFQTTSSLSDRFLAQFFVSICYRIHKHTWEVEILNQFFLFHHQQVSNDMMMSDICKSSHRFICLFVFKELIFFLLAPLYLGAREHINPSAPSLALCCILLIANVSRLLGYGLMKAQTRIITS